MSGAHISSEGKAKLAAALTARNRARGRGYCQHPLYARWAGMWQRCTNPNHVGWKNYGAKGIRVCERWRDFEAFVKDMGMPAADQSLERIDSARDYAPDNCRWASASEQSRNTNRNIVITHEGESMVVRDWEKRLGVKRGVIQRRLDLGWDPIKAITLPPQTGKPLRTRS